MRPLSNNRGETVILLSIGILLRQLAPVALAVGIVVAGAAAALAVDCAKYGDDAKRQSEEYAALNCEGGQPEWWRVDHEYHARWCRSLPANSPLPALGTAEREAVLKTCREGAPATLIIRNGTEFSVEAYVEGVSDQRIHSDTVAIPPFGNARVTVLPGEARVVATAMDIVGYPKAVRPVPMPRSGTYEIELMRDDFEAGKPIDCPRAVTGRWNWFVNGVATFYSDGVVRQGQFSGTWSCIFGDSVHIDWSHGYEDLLRLSPDAQRLSGNGSAKDTSGPQDYAVWGSKID